MTDQHDGADLDLRILSRDIPSEDAAAASAVIRAAAEAAAEEPPRTDGSTHEWVRAGRAHREPFERGPGRWNAWGR
ncbi:acyl-CoA carboxylase epsilon subunit [Agromyces sp. MMS24-K17]|uniref:acyl-CoA carboxylase epsilon subunit n=1 Tax=Agromyces sp. MMS24-K17 TaxID=3372850 RepID=UPI00375447E2